MDTIKLRNVGKVAVHLRKDGSNIYDVQWFHIGPGQTAEVPADLNWKKQMANNGNLPKGELEVVSKAAALIPTLFAPKEEEKPEPEEKPIEKKRIRKKKE